MKILKIFGITAFLIFVLTSSISGFDNKAKNNSSLLKANINTNSESLTIIQIGELLKNNKLTCSRHSEKPIIAHKAQKYLSNSGLKI